MEEPKKMQQLPLLAKEIRRSDDETDGNEENEVLETKPDHEKQVKLFNGHIILNPTISTLNFVTFICMTLYSVTVLMPVMQIQSPLLTYHYGQTLPQQASIGSINHTVDLVLHLILGPFFGGLSDTYGRKTMLVSGIILSSLTTIMMPHLPGVYPWWIILHGLRQIAFLSKSSVPLIADYIDFESKGRVASLVGALFLSGTFISQFINSKRDLQNNLEIQFHIFGGIALIVGVFITLGLKGGLYHKKIRDKKLEKATRSMNNAPSKVSDEADLMIEEKEYAKEGSMSAKDEILIIPDESEAELVKGKAGISKGITQANSYGYTSESKKSDSDDAKKDLEGRLNNSNDSVVHTSKKSAKNSQIGRKPSLAEEPMKPGIIAGLKQAKNPWILMGFILGFMFSAKIGLGGVMQLYIAKLMDKPNAQKETLGLQSKQTLTALISILFVGFYADKANKMVLVSFAILASILAVIFWILTPSADHWMIYASIMLMGLSSSGFMTINGQLINKYAEPQYRASAAAVGALFSMGGDILIGILGQYLFQFNPRIPYYMYLGVCAIGIATIAIIYCAKKHILNKI